MRTVHALMAFGMVVLVGCGGGDGGTEPIRVASVTVSPVSPNVAPGATVQLEASVKDQNGAALTGRSVTWASGNLAIATVSGSGIVTGVSAGSTTITATSEGVSGSATVTVTPAPVATVTLAPASPSIATGESATITATLRDAAGAALTGRTITWTTSAAAIATVAANGATATVTGVAPGSADITATSEGKTATATVTVMVGAFSPTTNATLGGARTYASVNIPAGVTVTVTSDLALTVTGPVTIAGTLTGECVPVSIVSDGLMTVTGAIANGCTTPPDAAAPTMMLVGKEGYVMDDADVESAGDVTITNNPALDESSFAAILSARTAARAGRVQASGLGAAAETRCTYRSRSNKRYRARPPKAKNGANGRNGVDGRNGSTFRMMCDGDMLFTGGVVVQAQHGGDGGNGTHEDNVEASASGGDGGTGGNVRVLGTGAIVFTGGANRLQSGDGGNGGTATATGKPNDPAKPKGTNATATGGKGGNTSKGAGRDGPIWVRGGSITVNPDGLSPNALTMTIGKAGDGGKAEATAANGQNATATNDAQNGGDATATGGDGGRSLPLQFNASGQTLGSGDVMIEGGNGGFGGDANGTAGNGGTPNDTRKKGGDGGDLAVEGGVGGNAETKELDGSYVGLWGLGGRVQFTGGNGFDGFDECKPRLVEGGRAGKGGNAAGGDGAMGILGLSRPAPTDNTILVNGVGNGAEGGDGWGPASKGGAGTDGIRAPVGKRLNTAQNFTPGADGKLCQRAEQFLTWVGKVLEDPAGHDPFVQWLTIAGINFSAIDALMRFTGASPMVPLQGGWDATLKKFVLTGSGTVAGRANTPIRAECTPGANGALVCVITIGGPTAMPPLTTPIVYQFDLTVPE